MTSWLKGKPVADSITENNRLLVKKWNEIGIMPGLMLIRVGEKPDDLAYERAIIKRCHMTGIRVRVEQLSESVAQNDFLCSLQKHNEDPEIHGILVFRPLPSQLKEEEIRHHISVEKDVDGFHPMNSAELLAGDERAFAPCTPAAVMAMLEYYQIPLEGVRATVLGRSMVVGKPAALMLLKKNATVTIAHSRTPELETVTREADVLVAAVGKADMITERYVKKGAVIMDVGINVDGDGNLTGDVDGERVDGIAKAVTPVPGGIGSVTTAVLARHVLKACERQHGK